MAGPSSRSMPSTLTFFCGLAAGGAPYAADLTLFLKKSFFPSLPPFLLFLSPSLPLFQLKSEFLNLTSAMALTSRSPCKGRRVFLLVHSVSNCPSSVASEILRFTDEKAELDITDKNP